MPLLHEIRKPNEFNAAAIAAGIYQNYARLLPLVHPSQSATDWDALNEADKRLWIDAAQQLLNELWSEGVIG